MWYNKLMNYEAYLKKGLSELGEVAWDLFWEFLKLWPHVQNYISLRKKFQWESE